MSRIYRETFLICGLELQRSDWEERRDDIKDKIAEKSPMGGDDPSINRVDEIWADFESEWTCQNDMSNTLRLAIILGSVEPGCAEMVSHAKIKMAPPTHKSAWLKNVKRWYKGIPDLPMGMDRVFHDLCKSAATYPWEFFLVSLHEDG